MTQVHAHGFVFNVEGDGFVRNNAAADFERGVEAIQTALEDMDKPDVVAFVAEMMAWQSNDCEGTRPALADRLETIGHKAATEGWHRPNAVGLTVSIHQ